MDILINGILLGAAFAMMGLGFALLFGVGKVFDWECKSNCVNGFN